MIYHKDIRFIVKGGIIPEWSYDLHRCILASEGVKFAIHFHLGECLGRENSHLNIRVVFPDGEKTVRQVEVIDNKDLLRSYHVETEFTITNSNRGIGYAELLRDKEVIAGIVFSTAGPMECGSWERDELEPIDGYTIDKGESRLRDKLIFALPWD